MKDIFILIDAKNSTGLMALPHREMISCGGALFKWRWIDVPGKIKAI